MHAKTEEFLYALLWAAEFLTRPSAHKLNESFEGWAYRTGVHRQLLRLEREQWIESQKDAGGNRLLRLTEKGRLQALGGRDPEVRWRRRWDRRWRLILFDVPEVKRVLRNKLRAYLRGCGFGYLQNSVWITPDPLAEQRSLFGREAPDVEEMILLECKACGGETDAQIVAGAWDFEKINDRYQNYRQILAQRPVEPIRGDAAAGAFQRWLRSER